MTKFLLVVWMVESVACVYSVAQGRWALAAMCAVLAASALFWRGTINTK